MCRIRQLTQNVRPTQVTALRRTRRVKVEEVISRRTWGKSPGTQVQHRVVEHHRTQRFCGFSTVNASSIRKLARGFAPRTLSPRKLLTFLPEAGQEVSRKPSHLGN